MERGEHSIIFKIEGTLTGFWVQELERVWRAESACRERHYCQADLSEVISVDAGGKKLLAQMYEEGVDLIAAAIETRAIVDEITRRNRDRK